MTKSFGYLFRTDFENPGDILSSPVHYIGEDFRGPMIDIFNNSSWSLSCENVIVGGGALLSNNKFASALKQNLLKVICKKKIIWGVEIDDDLDLDFLDESFLLSSRNISQRYNFDHVPCASCIHPLIRQSQQQSFSKNSIAVIDHFKDRCNYLGTYNTRISNKQSSFYHMIDTIKNHEVIITGSYHAAYWSLLLNKKVVISRSSIPKKFINLVDIRCIVTDFFDKKTLFNKIHQSSDSYYQDCLKKNQDFFRKVCKFTNTNIPDLDWLKI